MTTAKHTVALFNGQKEFIASAPTIEGAARKLKKLYRDKGRTDVQIHIGPQHVIASYGPIATHYTIKRGGG